MPTAESKRYMSTDSRQNITPEKPSLYFLPVMPLPEGYNHEKLRAEFAEDAHKRGLSKGQAEKEWYSHCDRIIETNRKQNFGKLQKAEEKISDDDDDLSFTLEETIALRDRIVNDRKSAYWSDAPKDRSEQKRLVALVTRYDANIAALGQKEPGVRKTIRGWAAEHDQQRAKTFQDLSRERKSSNGIEGCDLEGTRYKAEEPVKEKE